MPKIPDSEYIAHLQTLDLEGRIKYLLDMVKKQENEIGMLRASIQGHLKAHQVITELRNPELKEKGV